MQQTEIIDRNNYNKISASVIHFAIWELRQDFV